VSSDEGPLLEAPSSLGMFEGVLLARNYHKYPLESTYKTRPAARALGWLTPITSFSTTWPDKMQESLYLTVSEVCVCRTTSMAPSGSSTVFLRWG